MTALIFAALGLTGAVRYRPRGAFGADTSAAEAWIHVRRGLLVFVCPPTARNIVERLNAQAAALYAAGEERNCSAIGLDAGVIAYVIGPEKARMLAGEAARDAGRAALKDGAP